MNSKNNTGVKLTHAAVKVKNVKSSMSFFSEVLGMKAAWAGQTDWGMLKNDGTTLALIEENDLVHPPHVGLVVANKEDVDRLYAQLKDSAASDVELPKDHRDQSRSFYFKDPDGNQFELLWLPEHLTR